MNENPDPDIYAGKASLILAGVTLGAKTTDIYIDDTGIIRAIGEAVRTEYRDEADFILDAGSRIALPGLVNTHTHAGMTLLRGYADDMHLDQWLNEKIWPLEAHLTGDDVYWGTRLACLEMVKSGTVAFNDMYFFMEDAARAVADAGMRAQLAYGFIDLFDDERREKEIKATEALVHSIRSLDNPRITPAVGPHAIYTVSREGLEWLAGYSARESIGIHIHLSETESEVTACQQKNGMRPVQYLDECRCLTERTVAAHCCWLDKEECATLAARGVHVSHNPTSNMKLAVNRAMPYHWLREAGARVTLGTDGCASNNSLDLFAEMKCATLLQKFFWNSDTLLPAHEAFAMTTTGGAAALGLETGSIEVGKPADLILLNQDSVCMTPLHSMVSNIVYACSGNAVSSVLCDGHVLMWEREVPGEQQIIKKAAERARDLVRRREGEQKGMETL
jgi:5-methylthioadenosine/S-adenosylhomocysteine deaminase